MQLKRFDSKKGLKWRSHGESKTPEETNSQKPKTCKIKNTNEVYLLVNKLNLWLQSPQTKSSLEILLALGLLRCYVRKKNHLKIFQWTVNYSLFTYVSFLDRFLFIHSFGIIINFLSLLCSAFLSKKFLRFFWSEISWTLPNLASRNLYFK